MPITPALSNSRKQSIDLTAWEGGTWQSSAETSTVLDTEWRSPELLCVLSGQVLHMFLVSVTAPKLWELQLSAFWVRQESRVFICIQLSAQPASVITSSPRELSARHPAAWLLAVPGWVEVWYPCNKGSWVLSIKVGRAGP